MAVARTGQSLLKRAALSRPSGEWNDDDFDVLAAGIVVGRIMKAAARLRAARLAPRPAGFLRLPGCFPQPVRGSDRDGNARAMGLSWEAVGLSYLSTVVRHQAPAGCCLLLMG